MSDELTLLDLWNWATRKTHLEQAEASEEEERKRQLKLDNERKRLHGEKIKELDSKIIKERAKMDQRNSGTLHDAQTSDSRVAACTQTSFFSSTHSGIPHPYGVVTPAQQWLAPAQHIPIPKEYPQVISSGIGVIGLPKSGRNILKEALPDNGLIYKLNYPNNGFINGSINENRPTYDVFFEQSHLKNLSILIVTIDGAVREEDFLVLLLAKEFNIPTVIVRTKLDEWLDNSRHQTKEEYVQNDKQYVVEALKDLNFDYLKSDVYNVSALGMTSILNDGEKSEWKKYEQDEKALMERINMIG